MQAVDTIRRITKGDPDYPELLDRIAGAPRMLHVSGSLTRSDILAVAIVGSRRPTGYGRRMARVISGSLAKAGVTIVSGLARGIDTEAHSAALLAGGRTIAVLGCGLDTDYPRGTRELKARITASGALLSEFERDTPPFPGNFPSRNRIISGLSLGVIVVEAGSRSGSLITARWALDQGREVMAVPGRADSPLSTGPIKLIREGAAPVCDAEDILRILSIELPSVCQKADMIPDPVMAALVEGPSLPEEISLSTGLPLPKVLSKLSRLMIDGLVTKDDGGIFSLR